MAGTRPYRSHDSRQGVETMICIHELVEEVDAGAVYAESLFRSPAKSMPVVCRKCWSLPGATFWLIAYWIG